MITLILLLSVVILLGSAGLKKGLHSWSMASRLLEEETQRNHKPNYFRIATLERQVWGETWHHGDFGDSNIRCRCDSCSMVTKLKQPGRPSDTHIVYAYGYGELYYGYGIPHLSTEWLDRYGD